MKYHSMDSIYSEGVEKTSKGFECSVCGKLYKRENMANKHYEGRTCWNMVNLFKDTPSELTFIAIANVLLGRLRDVRAYTSMKLFRRSAIYQLVAKLVIYNTVHSIHDIDNYVLWGISKMPSNPSMILNFLIKDRQDFSEFFNFRRSILTEKEQYQFFEQNFDKLIDNPAFMIRQVEKGWLTFEYISSRINIKRWMSNLSIIHTQKVRELLQR